MTENAEEIDLIVEEFLTYKVAPDNQLPLYDPNAETAIDHFWSLMGRFKVVTSTLVSDSSLAYSNLTHLLKILLVLPHSNADPERLFSLVGNIETESRSLLNPSTKADLLNVKMNHDGPCYLSGDLMPEKLLKDAKQATSLQYN